MKHIIRILLWPIVLPVRCVCSVFPIISILKDEIYGCSGSMGPEWSRKYDIDLLKSVWNIK